MHRTSRSGSCNSIFDKDGLLIYLETKEINQNDSNNDDSANNSSHINNELKYSQNMAINLQYQTSVKTCREIHCFTSL